MNFDFGIFWDGLTTLGRIYWIIAIPSTAIFLILLLLSLIGGDKDIDAVAEFDGDIDIDHDYHGADLSGHTGFGDYFLSFKTIMSFLTMFSWVGIIGLYSQLAAILTIIISIIAGFLMMISVSVLLYYLNQLQYSGTMEFKNAIGQDGEVYITIPANKSGVGKVQVKVQGSLRTLDAVTEEQNPIKTKSKIEVINILDDNILLVKSLDISTKVSE